MGEFDRINSISKAGAKSKFMATHHEPLGEMISIILFNLYVLVYHKKNTGYV